MTSSTFFQGSIPQAIAEAQSKSRFLVVFISGKDEESLKLEEITWQDSKVIEEIHRGCVALKIAGGSIDALKFSTIFPIHRVPTISVFGFTGALLQQHEGYISPKELVDGLQQLQHVATAGAIATILSSAHLARTVPTPATAGHENDSTTGLPEPTDESASVLSREVSPPPVEGDCSGVEPSHRGRGDARNMSEIELATSNTSGLEKIAVHNQASAAIKAAESMKAAHKVKATSKQAQSDSKLTNTPETKTLKERSGPFLLQIRLTNSENIRGEFEATNTLRDVKIFVDKNRTDGSKSYSFVIPFPRKSLTPDDLDRSLAQLELGPRSTVMIVPSRMTSEGSSWSCATASGATDEPSTSVAGGSSFTWRFLSYLNPFSYFRWGASPSNQENSSDWEYDSEPAGAREADERESRGTTAYTSPMSGAEPQTRSLNQRKGWGVNGNVHTLRNDDDDEVFRGGNSYWNGNSTQFGGEDDNKRD